jgi:molybdopterin molybdotransferase
MQTPEINKGEGYAGYNEALGLVLNNTNPNRALKLPLSSCVGFTAADDACALVDSPTHDTSLKDGYALKAEDVNGASPSFPAALEVVGTAFAGGSFKGIVKSGEAVRICTGSALPECAEAVVVAELCQETNGEVLVKDTTRPGKNVFRAGADVRAGSILVEKGEMLLPGKLALAAAGGVSHLVVYPRPKVALIAIGDEVVAPGRFLKAGEVYSSNLVNLGAWLSSFGIRYYTTISKDEPGSIKKALKSALRKADVVLTGGGAWASERDLVVSVLDELGWKKVFRYVRMGPGKGITFGTYKRKPVFCLPGSPPSNDMAFLQLALPGILRLAGMTGSPFPLINATLTGEVRSRSFSWAEIFKGKLTLTNEGEYLVTPYFEDSRLGMIANAHCLITKPENSESLSAGKVVTVQVLAPALGSLRLRC